MELTQKEIERLMDIEAAAKELICTQIVDNKTESDYIKAFNDMSEALKPVEPDIDWSTLPVCTPINFKYGETKESAYFIKEDDNNEEMILTINNSRKIAYYHKDYCTVEQKLSTELVKHPAPKDGRQPEWVSNSDLVIHQTGEVQAQYLAWDSEHLDWFAVVRS